jgi:hypothetical protein
MLVSAVSDQKSIKESVMAKFKPAALFKNTVGVIISFMPLSGFLPQIMPHNNDEKTSFRGARMIAWVVGSVGVWLLFCCESAFPAESSKHVWELQEIELHASKSYANPYVDVETWVELTGPSFAKRVYGFWDGGNLYRVRIVATAPGMWSWISGST